MTLLLAVVLMVNPVSVSPLTLTRCRALTAEINQHRSPDLSVMRRLCKVAVIRARQFRETGHMWHDLRPVMASLRDVCWTNVGEVLAWNNYAGSAAAFVSQWSGSLRHWSVLVSRRYDRGGGAFVNGANGHWAVYYVLDTC